MKNPPIWRQENLWPSVLQSLVTPHHSAKQISSAINHIKHKLRMNKQVVPGSLCIWETYLRTVTDVAVEPCRNSRIKKPAVKRTIYNTKKQQLKVTLMRICILALNETNLLYSLQWEWKWMPMREEQWFNFCLPSKSSSTTCRTISSTLSI